MKPLLEKIPLYILLFPVLTILILAGNNLGQIQADVIWTPLLSACLLSLSVFCIVIIFFRNVIRAGLFTFSFLLFGLTYGHIFDVLKDRVIGKWVIGTHFYILIFWGLSYLFVTYLVAFKSKSRQTLSLIINIVMLVMVVLQIGRIVIYEINTQLVNKENVSHQNASLLNPDDSDELPDVYYIILDKYARSDVIKRVYGYDNSQFVEALEDLGFFVPKCSRSNYAFTVMSLSSQLNMAFVEDLTVNPSLETTTALIKNNIVHQAFEEIGYTTISFDMGFSWGNMKGSDYYFDEFPKDIETWSLTPFEIMYLKSTLARLLFEQDNEIAEQITLSDLERKAERTQLILEVLPRIPEMEGSKFVHAHIISPHPPYIFNADGSINPNAEEISDEEGYPEQLAFLEPRLIEIVRKIISDSATPPIIILEGDHGFGSRYVTSNFMALYLPGNGAEGLDDNMTMINVFPHIFKTYFGADIDYLPDISYTHTDDWYESVVLEEWNPECIGE